MRWADLAPARGWHVLSSRILAVNPRGHTLEVVARGAGQPVSRAHVFTFRVDGHEPPADDLSPATDLHVEAQPAQPSIRWTPVKPQK